MFFLEKFPRLKKNESRKNKKIAKKCPSENQTKSKTQGKIAVRSRVNHVRNIFLDTEI